MYQRVAEVQYLPSSHPCWGDAEWVRRIRRCDARRLKEPVWWQFPEWHHVREVRSQTSCRPFRLSLKGAIRGHLLYSSSRGHVPADKSGAQHSLSFSPCKSSLLERNTTNLPVQDSLPPFMLRPDVTGNKSNQSTINTAPFPVAARPGAVLLPWCLVDGVGAPVDNLHQNICCYFTNRLHIQSNVWVAHISLLAYKTQVVGNPSECLQLSERLFRRPWSLRGHSSWSTAEEDGCMKVWWMKRFHACFSFRAAHNNQWRTNQTSIWLQTGHFNPINSVIYTEMTAG